MTNRKKDRISGALLGTLMMGTVIPNIAMAEQVLLTSDDGSINFVGEIIDFSDGVYLMSTSLGDLRIEANRVRCEGAACPAGGDVASAASSTTETAIDTPNEAVVPDILIAGSDTMGLGLMPLMMQGYALHNNASTTFTTTDNPREVIASVSSDSSAIGAYMISSSGSGDAFKALQDGSAHLGMSSRRITPQEARTLRNAGAGNMTSPRQEHIVAVDGLVMIVHPSNPIDSLSKAQISNIYTGRITNWAQVGGPDLAIKSFTRQDNSGTRAVFQGQMLGAANARVSRSVSILPDNNEMAAQVVADPAAIGYVGFAFQRGAKAVSIVNECGIRQTPDTFSAKTEEYELRRRLYLYNRADVSDEKLLDFVDFAISTDADDIVQKAGFIDLGVEVRKQGLNSSRAASLLSQSFATVEGGFATQMMEEMVDYDRLSTTFRFQLASSELDDRGQLDMERLVQFMKSQPDTAELVMVGFTDSIGTFQNNLNLSIRRANAVIGELNKLYPDLAERVSIKAGGYGETAPVACNTSGAGRAINRRVEVWLKTKESLATNGNSGEASAFN